MSRKQLSDLDFAGVARIRNLPAPVNPDEPVRQQDLNSAVEGLAWKDSCRVASQANLNLSSPGASIDGITVVAGERVLVKAQTVDSENGIYIWNGAGVAMTRSLDANTSEELEQAITTVEEGTSIGMSWRQSVVNFVLGTGSVTCLMKEGRVQQYAPPLEIYNEPANIFVADFVGNPTMNFIAGTVRSVDLDSIKIEAAAMSLSFTPGSGSVTLGEDQTVVLGVRPEYLRIGTGGAIGAMVYSTLPSGMETIVKIKVGEQFLTSVVFGAIDFLVNEAVSFDFIGNRCVLFDAESGRRLASGNLET